MIVTAFLRCLNTKENHDIQVFVSKSTQADVIICSASKNLDLSKGRMSKNVLDAAGQEIQVNKVKFIK